MIASIPARAFGRGLAVALFSVCPILATAPCVAGVTPWQAGKGATGFPLLFKGVEVNITSHLTRDELSAKLEKLLGKATPMNSRSRLQYDVQFDADEAPVAVVFDWNNAGVLVGIMLDASSEAQNPPATSLRNWLVKNAGPGKSARSKDGVTSTTWEYRGWRFTLRKGGDGEDAVFGFTMTGLEAGA